jgi:hypothetical protein
VASEAETRAVKDAQRARLWSHPGTFGVMTRRAADGEWTIEVTIAPGHPLPPAERLDGVAVRYVHGERPAPL